MEGQQQNTSNQIPQHILQLVLADSRIRLPENRNSEDAAVPAVQPASLRASLTGAGIPNHSVAVEDLAALDTFLHMLVQIVVMGSIGFLRSVTTFAGDFVRDFCEQAIRTRGQISTQMEQLRSSIAVEMMQRHPGCLQGVGERKLLPLDFVWGSGITSIMIYHVCQSCSNLSTRIGRKTTLPFEHLQDHVASGCRSIHSSEACTECAGQLTRIEVVNPTGFVVGCPVRLGRCAHEGTVDQDFPPTVRVGQLVFNRACLLVTVGNGQTRLASLFTHDTTNNSWKKIDTIHGRQGPSFTVFGATVSAAVYVAQ